MTPELLAPAGSPEALKAAVSAGADAIYLGAASFGARAAVGFSPEELKAALRFAHLHGRKIYVTVNTLVKDAEIPALRDELRRLCDDRADAVLIQDLGVWRLCREEFPGLALHASTQMTLHTPSGIRWAADHGIRRVVLNREATLGDIRAAVQTGVETEVFAHGALCVSVSGQCLLSSSVGERSGNRGRCAQPCRHPYRYCGEERAWLSPSDLCTLPMLDQLVRAGVSSLKLEGRLKRPEYVYIVTDVYRRALDRIAEDRTAAADLSGDMDALTQIFCRGRFTQGYAAGAQDAGIVDADHIAHEGVRIGAVERITRSGNALLARFTPSLALSDQDGLSVGPDQCIYNGPDVPAGRPATLRLHRDVPAGTPVCRTESARQLAGARAMYDAGALKKLDIPFCAELTAFTGRPAVLKLTATGAETTVDGPIAEQAQKHPLTEADVRRALEKTGDTPFTLDRLTVRLGDVYLSSAQLNAMRREGLAALEDAVIALCEPPAAPAPAEKRAPSAVPAGVLAGRWIVRTECPEEIPALLEAGADHVLLALRDTTAAVLGSVSLPETPAGTVSLLLPPLADDATLSRLMAWARERGLSIAADNAGQLSAAPEIAMTAEGIPVFNAETERFLAARGVRAAVLSPELSRKELEAMPAPALERILPVYGRTRLMLLSHCPERTKRGCTADRSACRRCEADDGLRGRSLVDRKGLALPMIPYRTDRGCVVRLYSGQPVSLQRFLPELNGFSFLISFTDEPAAERPRIVRAFRTGAPALTVCSAGKYLTGVL